METITPEVIEKVTTEHRKALLEYLEISKKENVIKAEKIAAQKKLSMARDELRALSIN